MKQNYTKVYSIFHKILQMLPQTTVSSPKQVAFLILDDGKHGEHRDHVCPHPISQKTWLWEKRGSENIHKNARLILMIFNLKTETFLWIKLSPNL